MRSLIGVLLAVIPFVILTVLMSITSRMLMATVLLKQFLRRR